MCRKIVRRREVDGVAALNSMVELNVGLLLFAAMVALILFAGVQNNQSAGSIFMKFFLAMLVVDMGMLLGEAGLWLWAGDPSRIPLLKFCAFLSVGFGALLNGLFIYSLIAFLSQKTKSTWRYANVFAGCCGCCFLLAICSLYNGLLFDINTAGFYQDGASIKMGHGIRLCMW